MTMIFGADAGLRPGAAAHARPEFRDILDDLLSDHADTATPGIEGLDRLLASVIAPPRRETPLPMERPAPAARPAPRLSVVAPAAQPAPRKPRRKTTQYLVEDIFARLEMARDSLGAASGRRISKSGIVNAALGLALSELESRGEHSRLARTMLRGAKTDSSGKE